MVKFENSVGWFTEGVELQASKIQVGWLPDFSLVFENEESTSWPPDDFTPLEQEKESDLLHEDPIVFGNENEFHCSFLNNVAFEKGNKFAWYAESDVALKCEIQSGSLLDGIMVPTCENKFVWLFVIVAGYDNENRLWGPANEYWGSTSGNIVGRSHDNTVVLESEDNHEWMADDLVLLNDLEPLVD